MAEETKLDLDFLLDKCQVASGVDAQVVIENLIRLDNEFPTDKMAEVYRHFLQYEHDPDVLLFIVKQIDKTRPVACLDTLIDLLLVKECFKDTLCDVDKYINLRVNAAKVISNYKFQKAVLPLLYCLNNKEEHYKVRLSCAEALGKIGDKYAVLPLMDVVTDENEKSVYLRESAAVALGMIGDMRAVDSLVSILETKKSFMDKFTFLKERAIEALSKLNQNNERVFKALKNSLDDESPQIRINSIEALMNIGDEHCVGLIKKMLKDKDDEVVGNAVIALYNLEGKDAMTEILECEGHSIAARDEAQRVLDEYESDEDDEDDDE